MIPEIPWKTLCRLTRGSFVLFTGYSAESNALNEGRHYGVLPAVHLHSYSLLVNAEEEREIVSGPTKPAHLLLPAQPSLCLLDWAFIGRDSFRIEWVEDKPCRDTPAVYGGRASTSLRTEVCPRSRAFQRLQPVECV